MSNIEKTIENLEKCSAQIVSPKDKVFGPAAQLIRELQEEVAAARDLLELSWIGDGWGVVVPPEWTAARIDRLARARLAVDLIAS